MVKRRRRVAWTTLAAVLLGSGPLLAQKEEGAASTVLAPEGLKARPGAVTLAVDEAQRVSYRRGGRTVSMALVTDRVLIQGKRGYEVVRVDPARRSRFVAQAVRADGEIPLFVADTGELRAPVGGVVLVLSESWDSAEVEAFLVEHGLNESVTPVRWRKNGLVVSTVAGAFAIELANRLAGLAGVEVAVPNFWTEVAPR